MANGAMFDEYVLTARHCVMSREARSRRLGVNIPASDDYAGDIRSKVFDATVAYVSRARGDESAGSVAWDEGDWAILRVRTPVRWPAVPITCRDPMTGLEAGSAVELLAYSDRLFIDAPARRGGLRAHAHLFRWTGVPAGLEQGGHSGAPVERNGELVAIFVGTTQNSRGCQLLCGQSWPTRLRFVSVATVRRQAAKVGFLF